MLFGFISTRVKYGTMNKRYNCVSYALLVLLLAPVVLSLDELYPPMIIQGRVIIDGSPADTNTEVIAYFDDGKICGTSLIKEAGLIENLACAGTPARKNQAVYFRINRELADTLQNLSFQPGSSVTVDIYQGDKGSARSALELINSKSTASYSLFLLALLLGLVILTANLVIQWIKRH